MDVYNKKVKGLIHIRHGLWFSFKNAQKTGKVRSEILRYPLKSSQFYPISKWFLFWSPGLAVLVVCSFLFIEG